jgi:hypothetical protein
VNGFTDGEIIARQVLAVAVDDSHQMICKTTSVWVVSADEVTIRTSRGKACYKSPFLARQLSVFFAPTRYRVVKIVHFYSEVVL